MALAAFVVGVLALFKVDATTTTQISGIIMSLGAVIAYIVGEGLVDAAAVNTPTQGVANPVAKAAGDIAAAAQAVKAVAEDATPQATTEGGAAASDTTGAA
jgi:hypothetical protein